MKRVIIAAFVSFMVTTYVTAAILVQTGHVVYLPTCRYEDGNPDGKPCSWTDPDTGNKYVVDSSEYRN